jgi:hypothetical protein
MHLRILIELQPTIYSLVGKVALIFLVQEGGNEKKEEKNIMSHPVLKNPIINEIESVLQAAPMKSAVQRLDACHRSFCRWNNKIYGK